MQKLNARTSRPQQTTLAHNLIALARYGLMGRRGMFTVGGGFAIGGLFLGWDWLVAAGLAPIILALAPCAVMCGLGLCMMNQKGGKSYSSKPDDAARADEKLPNKSLADATCEQPVQEVGKR